MPEIWTHEMPMRWGDLDILNHVTNVVYLDYAAEAQAVLRRDGLLENHQPVRDITATYLRPTVLSSRPLLLRATLDGDVLTQEICTTTTGDGPVVHASIVTTNGPPKASAVPVRDDEPLAARMRMTDLDVTGFASLSGQFRLAQESRIVHLVGMGGGALGQFVVGRISLQPLVPISWQPDPLQARSWITRVGRGSFTIETMLSEHAPLFTSQTTLVGFDTATQSSRPFSDAEREHLLVHST